ncbi:MAG: hypothetical protein IPO58_08100 [Betaproteobacteria bacterium]|nr:hypothetical protein [Betaproteobacteria bacterium]MBK9606360.1 hypothetical protein [Betaproteobacteria bacterium]
MLLLRIILVLSLISLAVSGAMYLYTRDRRYLRFIGQTVKYVVFIMIGVLAFLALERVLVML